MNEKYYADEEDFQDPLSNYEPRTYADPLEEALAEEPVTAIQHTPFLTVGPEATVAEALAKLAELKAACLLIVEDDRLVGVFTERDMLDKIALEYDDVKDRPVSDFMNAKVMYVHETDPTASALAVMAVGGYRHVPVLDLDEKVHGIIGPYRVTQYLQKHVAAKGE